MTSNVCTWDYSMEWPGDGPLQTHKDRMSTVGATKPHRGKAGGEEYIGTCRSDGGDTYICGHTNRAYRGDLFSSLKGAVVAGGPRA